MPRLVGLNGRVKVKCVAKIPGVYWETNEVQLVVDQRVGTMQGRSSSGEFQSHLTSAGIKS